MTPAHQVFRSYGETGVVSQRRYFEAVLKRMLGAQVIKANLPSSGRATVIRGVVQARDIVHLLYAPMMSRGRFKGKPIEVIEDIPPLHDVGGELASASTASLGGKQKVEGSRSGLSKSRHTGAGARLRPVRMRPHVDGHVVDQ